MMAYHVQGTSGRMSLAEDQVYALPAQIQQIEVLSGGAWVSIGLDDVVVHRHEAIQLHPGWQQVIVTPLGKARLEFVMSA